MALRARDRPITPQLRYSSFRMSDFKNLKVWQKAQILALDTHRVACKIRGSNNGGLRNQAIRAAMSVPANIVESRGQLTRPEACRYLRIALNSATELEYHLLTARELKAISGHECLTLTSQLVEVRKMLYGLIRSLSNRGDPDKPRDQS
jgi:four helix bundle protein